jgi:hypothetical protein
VGGVMRVAVREARQRRRAAESGDRLRELVLAGHNAARACVRLLRSTRQRDLPAVVAQLEAAISAFARARNRAVIEHEEELRTHRRAAARERAAAAREQRDAGGQPR